MAARQFEKDMPEMQKNLFENVSTQERRRLAGELGGTKSRCF